MNKADTNLNGQERRKMNFISVVAGTLTYMVVGSYGHSLLIVAKIKVFKEL